MKQYVIFAALCASLTLSACATTGTSNQTAMNDTETRTVQTREVVSGRDTADLDDDEMICRRRQVTGTRIKKVICRTWGEWQRIEDQSSTNAKRMQDRMRGQCVGEAC